MKKVLVLMSTYNGEKYIKEQIDSVITQQGVEVHILVRDDGSTDSTLSILQKYKEAGRLDFYTGENMKPAKSFMHLIQNAPEADYYALCDQDDEWLQGKLEKAVRSLDNIAGAGMYYHAMNLVDVELKKYGNYFRNEEFAKSLVHSCLFGDEIAGCTMVINRKLIETVKLYRPDFITMHDGWLHRICLCVDGKVIGDKTPYINYRQHGHNAVGMSVRSAKIQFSILQKKEKRFSKIANEMLKGYEPYLDSKECEFLRTLGNYNTIRDKIKIINVGFKTKASAKQKVKLSLKIMAGSF